MYFNKNFNRGTKQDLKKTGETGEKQNRSTLTPYLSNLNSPIWAANKDYIYTDTHIRPKRKRLKHCTMHWGLKCQCLWQTTFSSKHELHSTSFGPVFWPSLPSSSHLMQSLKLLRMSKLQGKGCQSIPIQRYVYNCTHNDPCCWADGLLCLVPGGAFSGHHSQVTLLPGIANWHSKAVEVLAVWAGQTDKVSFYGPSNWKLKLVYLLHLLTRLLDI